MGWCPVCKNEFVEGIKICPKCEVTLTDNKPEEEVETKKNIEDYLYNKDLIPDNAIADFDKDAFNSALDDALGLELLGDDNNDSSFDANDDENESSQDEEINSLFSSEDAAQTEEEVINIIREMTAKSMQKEQEEAKKHQIYEDKKVKIEETKSSAWSLIIVGVCGIVFILLYVLGVIPIQLSFFTKYITVSVMGLLFIVLIVMGIISFKSVKSIQKEASEEDKLSEEIRKWYKENLTKEEIDNGMFNDSDNEPEEMKYFIRISKIKNVINDKFMNLNNSYLDYICEEIYGWLYENKIVK